MTTPKAITFMVVGTLGAMALTYMMTLAACVIIGIEPPEKLMGSFKDAGMFVLGAFTGILVNTRTQQPEPTTLSVHASRDSTSNIRPAANSDTAASNPSSPASSTPNTGTNTPSISASATSTTESS